MNENINYLKNYDSVSDDVKFAANSIIRLRILAALFEKSQNMKELTNLTKLSYSSISTTLHGLEIEDFVYRESNKYYLSNSIRVQMRNILEFKEVVNLLDRFFNIIGGHVVDMIPKQSVEELYLLGNAGLVESCGMDANKIYNCIEDAIDNAKRAQCILPFYQLGFNNKLNCLVKNQKYVELIVSKEVKELYKRKSKCKYLSTFEGKNNFLLIVTDKMMILGFFKDDGNFDQNRLLISGDDESLIWAENMFKNFKKKNK